MAGLRGLPTEDITVDFGVGLTQRAESRRVPIGGMTVADNVQFTKDKAVRRRYGVTKFASIVHGSEGSITRLIPTKQQPIALDTAQNYRWHVPLDGGDTPLYDQQSTEIVDLNNYANVNLRAEIVAGSSYLNTCAVGASTTYRYVITKERVNPTGVSGDVIVAYVYDTQGKLLYRAVVSSTSTSTGPVLALTVNDTAYIFYALGYVYVRSLDLATGALGTEYALYTASGSAFYYDVQLRDDNTGFYMVSPNSGYLDISSRDFATPTSAVWSTGTAIVSTTYYGMCLARPINGTPTEVVVYYTTAADIKYAKCSTGGVSVSTGTYKATHSYTTPYALTALYNRAASNETTVILSGLYSGTTDFRSDSYHGSGLTSGTSYGQLAHELRSGLAYEATLDRMYYVGAINGFVNLYGLDQGASMYRSEAVTRLYQEDSRSTDGSIPSSSNAVPVVSGTTIYFPCEQTVTASSSTTPESAILRVGYTELIATTSVSKAVHLDGMHYAAGTRIITENTSSGFLDPPRIITHTSTTGPPVTPPTTTNRYFIAVARTQDRGRSIYSPASAPYLVASSTNFLRFTVFAPCYNYDHSPVYIDLYATDNNGSVYYLIYTAVADVSVSPTVYLYFFGLDTREAQPYTAGGAYENIPPASPRWVASAVNRLWAPSAENDTDLFFSTEPQVGEDVRWNPDFVVRVPSAGGTITAVVESNSSAIVFKERAIYVISGDGPSITGVGGSFSVDLLTENHGCESHKAVLQTPLGVLFKSATDGYWMLGGGQLQYVGAGVDDYKTNTVIASCVVNELNQARFLLSGGTDVLVYDYYYQQWSRFGTPAYADMVTSGDGYVYYLKQDTTTSYIYRESSDAYEDDATAFEAKLTTGWLNWAEVDGFARVRFMDLQGTYTGGSPTTMKVEVFRDYDESTVIETHTFTVSAATSAKKRVLGRCYFKHQKCKALKLRITFYTATYPEANFADSTLTAMVFRVALKAKAGPVAAGNRSTAT